MEYIAIGVAVAIGVVIMTSFFGRRARASSDAVTGGNPHAFSFTIAPAPPLAETIARLRELFGETGPAPTITRYTRTAVAVIDGALVFGDRTFGRFLTIPAEDVVSVDAGPVTLKPHGMLYASTFPSVLLRVRHHDTDVDLAIAPILGAYDKVSPTQAQSIAAELTNRLALARR